MTQDKPRESGPRVTIEHLGVSIDRLLRQAFVGSRQLHLTGTEFRLLEQLLLHPGQSLTRANLMKTVIAGGAIVLERTIDQHVRALRAKLGRVNLIETVRGVGYRCRGRLDESAGKES
jgi:two-component system phosphate regulon response regulator PhoB